MTEESPAQNKPSIGFRHWSSCNLWIIIKSCLFRNMTFRLFGEFGLFLNFLPLSRAYQPRLFRLGSLVIAFSRYS